ncbi:hypothetical protein [Novosphingobium sp. PC22D]|uniref:hypothetical protein n=1 Tax=Novosphingobium sp. PC22D TaxID=1962403 RepID=UPI001F0AAF24|nr:hypothetical protein [Novosphingobium sp. PC22D]
MAVHRSGEIRAFRTIWRRGGSARRGETLGASVAALCGRVDPAAAEFGQSVPLGGYLCRAAQYDGTAIGRGPFRKAVAVLELKGGAILGLRAAMEHEAYTALAFDAEGDPVIALDCEVRRVPLDRFAQPGCAATTIARSASTIARLSPDRP